MQKIFPRRGRRAASGAKEAPVPLVEYLQKVDIFKDLSPAEIEELFKGTMLRECTPGTVFFAPDDPTEQLFVLKYGQVDIYRLTPGGKRLVLRRIGPGTIFGEMGVLGQSMQGCFGEAMENSLVCAATQESIRQLLQRRPDITLRLLEAAGSRLRALEGRLEQAVFSPVKVRLARFLQANTDPATGLVKGYTHAEIGDTIGALRQTVTESLSEMQNQGLVEVGHKRIRITNAQGIEDFALGEEVDSG